MKLSTKIAVSVAALGLFAGVTAKAQIVFTNSGFTTPSNAVYGDGPLYLSQANGSQDGVLFNAGTGTGVGVGVTPNGGVFGVTGSASGQAAFLQGDVATDSDYIYEDITVTASEVGTYDLSFGEENRAGYSQDPLNVFEGSAPSDTTLTGLTNLGTFSTASTSAFVTETTPDFTISAPGTYRFAFGGTVAGGVQSFVTGVSINQVTAAVPEPSSMALLFLGAGSLIYFFRIRSQRV